MLENNILLKKAVKAGTNKQRKACLKKEKKMAGINPVISITLNESSTQCNQRAEIIKLVFLFLNI